ncbi:MAG: metal ABC transporter ATP-binding protein [Verrucomicrobiae bacterium]|nr:metal ABC transporter ATP-binding protein [Verrucomicrobiae bacterium]NNJ87697.1 metal ABC transporter ATP-binding protein [Akkermansiaceae bacterium]
MNKCTHRHDHGQTHELVIKDLDVAYRDVTVLKNIDLHAQCGNSLALVGPNGAGKSTLLKAIAGLIKHKSGSISWCGEDNVQCRGGEFAYLPQHEEVNWDFPITVRGVVEMGRYSQLGAWGRFSQKDDLAVEQALTLMEMDGELANRQISELSGGQKQRAFIARAVAQEAHVLLLDEPFTGLDRDHTANLTRLLRKLAMEHRLVIASHHDINTLADIFDQVLLLNRNVIAYGDCETVLTEQNLDLTFKNTAND